MPNRTYQIEDSEGRKLGHVNVEVPEGLAVFDFALTPIVSTGSQAQSKEERGEPKVVAFLASPRTLIDTRPRSPEFPHDYIDESSSEPEDK